MGKNKKKGLRKRIKSFIDFVLGDDPNVMGHDFNPKFDRKLRAYAFISKQPLGGNKYFETLMSITEWSNGEGFDFSMSNDNKEKIFSLHYEEIELVLKGLDKMGYFNFDKDELREE